MSTELRRLDLERLKADADPREICRSIGMKMYPRGNRVYILCPGHRTRLGKDDSNPTNAVLTEHGYHCFACGCSVGVADMICEYLGCGIGEAFRIMADTLGGGNLYGSQDRPDRLVLSNAELKALRFSLLSGDGVSIQEVLNSAPETLKPMLKKRAARMIRAYSCILAEYSVQEGAYALYEYADVSVGKRMDMLEAAAERIKVCKELIRKLDKKM